MMRAAVFVVACAHEVYRNERVRGHFFTPRARAAKAPPQTRACARTSRRPAPGATRNTLPHSFELSHAIRGVFRMKRVNDGFLEADGHSDSRKPSPTTEVTAKPDGCEAAVPAKQSGTASYFAHRKVNAVLAIACCAALVVLFVLALGAGRAGIAPSDVVGILANALLGTGASYSDMATNIVLNVRLPRVVATLLIGAALAISGASYQGLFRNPMVSPDILAHRPAHRLAPHWHCCGTSTTMRCKLWRLSWASSP